MGIVEDAGFTSHFWPGSAPPIPPSYETDMVTVLGNRLDIYKYPPLETSMESSPPPAPTMHGVTPVTHLSSVPSGIPRYANVAPLSVDFQRSTPPGYP